ncbi:MAG: hypothetical protein R3C32_02380 [Chloroflexota bacterium]
MGSGILEDGALADYAQDVLWPIAVADRQAVLFSGAAALVPAVEAPGSVAAVVDRPRVWVSSFGADPADQSRLTTSIDLAADAMRLVKRGLTRTRRTSPAASCYRGAGERPRDRALLQSAAFAEPEGTALEGASLSMMRPLVAIVDRAGLPDEADPALAAAVAAGDVAVVPGDLPARRRPHGGRSPSAMAPPRRRHAGAGRRGRPAREPADGASSGAGRLDAPVAGAMSLGPERRALGDGESALETEGYIRDGRFYRYARNAPQARTCAGGTGYSEILGCVSVPATIVWARSPASSSSGQSRGASAPSADRRPAPSAGPGRACHGLRRGARMMACRLSTRHVAPSGMG